MKEIEPETFISSTQIAEILGMKHSTLRKYAKIIDEKANGSFFERNHAGDRLFTYDHVEVFKNFIELKNSPDNTLESAAIILVGLEQPGTNDSSALVPSTVNKDHELLKELINAQQSMVNDLKTVVEQKDKQIEQLNLLVEQLIGNNETIMVEVKQNTKQVQELVNVNQQKKSNWAFWKK